MLRIRLSSPQTHDPTESSQSVADRYAIRYGLLSALAIVVYNLAITAFGSGKWELAHLLIFVLLFLMIGYGMNRSRRWIRADHALDDRMLFGLVFSIAAAVGLIALNGLLALINYHFEVSEIFLPIDDGFRFAVNSMGLFWGCLIFGFLSTFIFANAFGRKGGEG